MLFRSCRKTYRKTNIDTTQSSEQARVWVSDNGNFMSIVGEDWYADIYGESLGWTVIDWFVNITKTYNETSYYSVATNQLCNRTTSVEESRQIGIRGNDPVCQTFIFYANEYPNGCFIKSVKAFFRNKPDDNGLPVTCYLLGKIGRAHV